MLHRVLVLVLVLFASLFTYAMGKDNQTGRSSGSAGIARRTSLGAAMDTISTPEADRRREMRREIQRSGFAATLQEILRGEALYAVASWVRMRLQLDYGVPRTPLYVEVASPWTSHRPGADSLLGRSRQDPALREILARAIAPPASFMVPLTEDRSMPADPWKKE